jgi:hypothetical protein
MHKNQLWIGLIAISQLFSACFCLAQEKGAGKRSPNQTVPVAAATASNQMVDRLKQLKDLYEQGLITREVYDQKMKEVLDSSVTSEPPTQPGGLILHYDFAQPANGGKVTDLSGEENHARVSGARWISTGKSGGAYEFTTDGDRIRLPNKDKDALNVEYITISAWVKTTCKDGHWRRIFFKSWDKGYDLCVIGDWQSGRSKGVFRMNIQGENDRRFCDSGVSLTDGQWHHIAATYDGQFQWFFVDGKPQSRIEWKGKIKATKVPLTIGNDGMGQNAGESFRGAIGEVMLYNRALTPKEIQGIYESQKHKFPEPVKIIPALPLVDGKPLRYGLYVHFDITTFGDAPYQGTKTPNIGSLPATRFAPTALDVRQWARVARQAGMSFAILTAKHESGFCLWPAKDYDYSVAQSPVKTDILADFIAACKAEGLIPGIHYSIPDARGIGQEYNRDAMPPLYYSLIKRQTKELHTKYPDIQIHLFNGVGKISREQSEELKQIILHANPRCLVMDEQDVIGWQTVNSGYFWSPNAKLTSSQALIDRYLDLQEAGKPIPLNAGPDRTGRIPDDEIAVLMQLKQMLDHDPANEKSPDSIARGYVRDTAGWSAKSSEKLVAQFTSQWPDQLASTMAFMRTSLALYDCKRYEDALKVMEKLSEHNAKGTFAQTIALIWQGHLLDLLGRRSQAIERYQRALDGGIDQFRMVHDQYDQMVLNRAWVETRLKVPFTRTENKNK